MVNLFGDSKLNYCLPKWCKFKVVQVQSGTEPTVFVPFEVLVKALLFIAKI